MLSEKDMARMVALNKRNGWGFTANMLMTTMRKYRKAYLAGDAHMMEIIEFRLEDANFHTERGLLANKDFDSFKKAVKDCFRN